MTQLPMLDHMSECILVMANNQPRITVEEVEHLLYWFRIYERQDLGLPYLTKSEAPHD